MSQPAPAVIEIRVKHKGQELTVIRTQETDRVGRPIESAGDTMRAAAQDAALWLRRLR